MFLRIWNTQVVRDFSTPATKVITAAILFATVILFESPCYSKPNSPSQNRSMEKSGQSEHRNTWGLRLSGLPILLGMLDGAWDIPMSSKSVISPTFQYWNPNVAGWAFNVIGVGVEGSYHFNGAFANGMYVGGFARLVSLRMSYSFLSDTSTGNMTFSLFGFKVGYQKQWDSFYMIFGGNLVASSKTEVVITSSSGKTEKTSSPVSAGLGLDWQLGFAF